MFRTALCLLLMLPSVAFAGAPVIEVVLPDQCPKGCAKKTKTANLEHPFERLAPDDKVYSYPDEKNPGVTIPRVAVRRIASSWDIRAEKAQKGDCIWYGVYCGKIVPACHIKIENGICQFRDECQGKVVESLPYKEGEKLYLFFTEEEAKKFASD